MRWYSLAVVVQLVAIFALFHESREQTSRLILISFRLQCFVITIFQHCQSNIRSISLLVTAHLNSLSKMQIQDLNRAISMKAPMRDGSHCSMRHTHVGALRLTS